MNGEEFPVQKGLRRERIDLMNDRYIRGKYTFEDIEEIIKSKAVCNVPAATMHSLIGSGNGNLLIVEPGYGCKKVEDNFAVLSNFPVLTKLEDYSSPFYGKDRYDKALLVLSNADEHFSSKDALQLLYQTKQEGQWATRVSFVYSKNDNAVYYFLNGDISNLETHYFTALEGKND